MMSLCTRIYKNLSPKMAMKMGSKYNPNLVAARHWEELCKKVGYSYRALKETLLNLIEVIMQAAMVERQHFKDRNGETKAIEDIVALLEKNCSRTLKQFQE